MYYPDNRTQRRPRTPEGVTISAHHGQNGGTTMSIRASVVAVRMLQARGLSSVQVADAMAGFSLGCIILHAETVASQYQR